jgi:hypothetical protein
MKNALVRLLSSMKFWTMVAGLLTTLGAKYGFEVEQSTVLMIGTMFAILLGTQGLADIGKAAAVARLATAPAPTPAPASAPAPAPTAPVSLTVASETETKTEEKKS